MTTTIDELFIEMRARELSSDHALLTAANRRDAIEARRRTPEGAADAPIDSS